MKKTVGIILTAIGAVTAAASMISQMSVAVIGGADGPTAIFFGGRIGSALTIVGTIAGIALFAVGILMIAGKNKSKTNEHKNFSDE